MIKKIKKIIKVIENQVHSKELLIFLDAALQPIKIIKWKLLQLKLENVVKI
jgi:hypothetical protein